MKRSDGRPIDSLDPFSKIIPYIMEQRNDAQNMSKQVVMAQPILDYVKEKRSQGHELSVMHYFVALYVRLLALRPQLNRMVIGKKIYARKGIYLSMALKRDLTDEGEETTVKFSFEGTESIFQIVDIMKKGMDEAYEEQHNQADHLAHTIMNLPSFIIGSVVWVLKKLDTWNMLPQSIIEASPFHTSMFFTYLKSIRLDYIYHHLYNFGTTGIFVALGKEKWMPVVEKEMVVAKKVFEIGYCMDERICDGMYFSNSMKLLLRLMAEPALLEDSLDAIMEDWL